VQGASQDGVPRKSLIPSFVKGISTRAAYDFHPAHRVMRMKIGRSFVAETRRKTLFDNDSDGGTMNAGGAENVPAGAVGAMKEKQAAKIRNKVKRQATQQARKGRAQGGSDERPCSGPNFLDAGK
jgi:hypothetical protein